MNYQQVKCGRMRFVLCSSPMMNDQGTYLSRFKQNNVRHLVRLNELKYSEKFFEDGGIKCTDLMFEDGIFPPEDVIDRFLKLCQEVFFSKTADDATSVAVHCAAGIGRAPTMIAIAIIHYEQMTAGEAIKMIVEQYHADIANRLMNDTQQSGLAQYASHQVCCAIA